MLNIENKAILVSLSIKKWSPTKKAVQAQIDIQNNTGCKPGAVSASKHLLGGKENNSYADKLDLINKSAQAARDYFLEQTLPWANDGQRILLTRNKQKFDSQMRTLEGNFQQCVKDYVSVHSSAITEAKSHLGSLYDQKDFPDDIKAKYSFSCDAVPVPTGKDFRVQIAEDEIKEMQAALEARNNQLANDAMKSAFGKLHKEVKQISDYFEREKAAQAAGKKVRFHDSLIDNLKTVLSVIPEINLTDSKELKDLASEAEKELGSLSSEKIKEMKPSEKEGKKKAARKVAEQAAGFMGETVAA